MTTPDVFPHNVHVHDVQFRILDVDGGDPPVWLRGWKDTVPLVTEDGTGSETITAPPDPGGHASH